jgi:ketosteroid isomerase-like protein
MTTGLDHDLAALRDDLAVRELLHRYAFALDEQDMDLIASCFTPDVRAEYSGHTLSGGVQGIVGLLRGAGDFDKTMHHVGTIVVRLDGDRAEARSYTIAYLVGQEDGEPYLLTRGVRYRDLMRKAEDGWKIYDRVHAVDWSSKVPATLAPALPPEFVVAP